MTHSAIRESVRELNLMYLILAQSLIRDDATKALYQLGIRGELLARIGELTPIQIARLARSPKLLFRPALEDVAAWDAILRPRLVGDVGLHAAVLHGSPKRV